MQCIDQESGDGWTLINGDCVESLKGLPDHSIDYSIFSPPFASLYTYSNSPRDMGNCQSDEEFFEHFGYLIAELLRVMRPGHNVSFHCMLMPSSKQMHGYIGLRDFRGDLIRAFQAHGFIYHSEVCIWKDPVTAMQRTKALGLLYKTVKGNASMSRQGLPDYLVTMRAPGECPVDERVTHAEEEYPCSLWQRVASPVWMDIDASDTLQRESARDEEDERHICPLQLDFIERVIRLWSNPGETVFSPFAGIGSEPYTAVRLGRYGLGIELKPSYWRTAVDNLRAVEAELAMPSLFDEVES